MHLGIFLSLLSLLIDVWCIDVWCIDVWCLMYDAFVSKWKCHVDLESGTGAVCVIQRRFDVWRFVVRWYDAPSTLNGWLDGRSLLSFWHRMTEMKPSRTEKHYVYPVSFSTPKNTHKIDTQDMRKQKTKHKKNRSLQTTSTRICICKTFHVCTVCVCMLIRFAHTNGFVLLCHQYYYLK
jgi:hypothetical protein